jgi:hypothetical protein
VSGRRKRLGARLPDDWHESTEASVNGRLLAPGTEVSIKGERGRFRFVKRVSRDSGVEWLDFWGGPKGCEAWRSFRASQVRRVHRIPRTDKGVLDARNKAVSA